MAFKTKRDLIEQAFKELGVLAAGQALSAEDLATLDGQVEPFLADLSEREIAYINNADEIPIELFTDLSIVLADTAKGEYGLAGDTDLRNRALQAENRLRQKNRGRPTYKTLELTTY